MGADPVGGPGGFAPLGVSVGNLMAAGAFALVTMLPREALMSWGWRLPFLASIALVAWASGDWWPVAIYVIVLSLLTAWAIWAGPKTCEEIITADNSLPTASAQPARA